MASAEAIDLGRSYCSSCNEIGLEENADKTQYMPMSRDQNAETGHNIKIDDSTF
jgi:hypothetical protein